MNRVRFGVQGSSPLVDGPPDPAHYRHVAEAAEAAGFDSLWASDHLAFHHPLLDVTVALATFAAVTERIALGDGWFPLWVSPERYAAGLARLRPDTTAALVLPALVGGTVEEARRYLSRRYASEFTTHAIERYCVVGSPEQCAERIAEYVAVGARHIVFHPAVEPASLPDQFELLAEVTHPAAR